MAKPFRRVRTKVEGEEPSFYDSRKDASGRLRESPSQGRSCRNTGDKQLRREVFPTRKFLGGSFLVAASG